MLEILWYRFANVFLAFEIASKKNPKLSVKLAQTGRDLAQSMKLDVNDAFSVRPKIDANHVEPSVLESAYG